MRIDKEQTMEAIAKVGFPDVSQVRSGKTFLVDLMLQYRKAILQEVDKQPSAAVRVAHWQPHPSLDDIDCAYYHCSNCKHIVRVFHGGNVFERYPYCGRCGYEMEREVKP